MIKLLWILLIVGNLGLGYIGAKAFLRGQDNITKNYSATLGYQPLEAGDYYFATVVTLLGGVGYLVGWMQAPGLMKEIHQRVPGNYVAPHCWAARFFREGCGEYVESPLKIEIAKMTAELEKLKIGKSSVYGSGL